MSDGGRWFADGMVLPEGETVRALYVSGASWQLYATEGGGQALAVETELVARWIDSDWLEPGLFQEVGEYMALASPAGSMISSMAQGPFPSLNGQVLQLAEAMARCRGRMGSVSLADGLYIARLSLVLPTFTPAVGDDALVLGRWVTGGLNAPITDTARMEKYAPWLNRGTLERVLKAMGLSAGAGVTEYLEAPPTEEARKARPIEKRRPRQPGVFSLPGRPEVERFFREEIIDVVDREAEYKRMGIEFPGPTLLYGPPGCGKTFAVDRLAEYLNWPVYRITSGSVGSKYIHETSKKVSEIFDTAIANAPSMIVIDELEAFLSSRENSSASGEIHLEEVAEFLRRIPDAAPKHVLLMGMTNMPDAIDKAILRRGRFDHKLELGPPSVEELVSLLESLLKPLPTTGDLALDELARRLRGRPISDVSFCVREAGRMAVREDRRFIDAGLLSRACDKLGKTDVKARRVGFS